MWRDTAPAQDENCGAGDHDSEAESEDDEALPVACAGEMEKKWRLDGCGAEHGEGDWDPEQASSDRR